MSNVISSINDRCITHNCKIRPGAVVIYRRYHNFPSSKTQTELDNLLKGKDGDYNGFMSPTTARKVRTLLENWLQCLEQVITRNWQIDTKTAFRSGKDYDYYPTFITLTLPAKQRHDDNFIKRELLNRFIITLKNRHQVMHYFWRAEPQKNGNIHFHILCDRWIHWKAVRAEWNKILNDHGYIDAYRQQQTERHKNGYTPDRRELQHRLNKLRDFHEFRTATYDERGRIVARSEPFDQKAARRQVVAAAKKAYEYGVETNWSDPNSTDIHAIEKVDSITAYVVKYVTKTDGADIVRELNEDQTAEIETTRTRKIIGRIWGCSDSLRNLKHFEDEIATEVAFRTMTHDNEAFKFVCHLEHEAKERQKTNPNDDSVWQDSESGTTVYRLDQKAHIILRNLFPELFISYAQHYVNQYNTLYGKNLIYTPELEYIKHIPKPDPVPDFRLFYLKPPHDATLQNFYAPLDSCPF